MIRKLLLSLLLLFAVSQGALAACPVGSGCVSDSGVYAKTYGAICDGGSHPLSGTYGSLGAAQAAYPLANITSLTQQIDYAALKQASSVAFGADGAEHGSAPGLNSSLHLPTGTCNIGSDTWLIRKLSGALIQGAGFRSTVISGTGQVLAFDGLWYSRLVDFSVSSSSGSGASALDIDGNIPGHPYGTFGVQADTFDNIFVDGGGGTIAVSVCRQSTGSGQCSEMVWINPHFSNATQYVYYQNGFNALDNLFIGGDIQTYQQDAVYIVAGAVKIYGTSFESNTGYTQLANGGCDVEASSSSAGDTIIIDSVRSESMCVFHGGAEYGVLRGVNHQPAALPAWSVGTYSSNQMVRGVSTDGLPRAFRVTTAGTSAGTQPTWPTSGTVTDGGITWTYLPYTSVSFGVGVPGVIDNTSQIADTSTIIPGVYQNLSSCGTGQTGFGGNSNVPDMGSTIFHGSLTEGNPSTGCTVALDWHATQVASNVAAPIPAAPLCIVTSPTGTALTSYGVTFSGSGTIWNLTWAHASTTTPQPKFVWQCSKPGAN